MYSCTSILISLILKVSLVLEITVASYKVNFQVGKVLHLEWKMAICGKCFVVACRY